MKKCPSCKEVKQISEFNSDISRNDKLCRYCRICSAQKTRERKRRWKVELIEKMGGCCIDCKVTVKELPAVCFDFHHLDDVNKDFRLSRSVSKAKAFREVEKTVLLCANCHRKRHYKETLY